MSCFRGLPGGAGRLFIGAAEPVANAGGFGDHVHEAGAVEVDVGERGEQRIKDEAVGCGVGPAQRAQPHRILADPLELIDQHILQVGRRLILAAYAFGGGATRSCFRSRRLFALKAKHKSRIS